MSAPVSASPATLSTHEYDVALSLSGEPAEREYVRSVAIALRDLGLRVFFDEFEKLRLWGRNLVEEFQVVYGEQSHFAVIFVSAAYASSEWARIERRAAVMRAARQEDVYLLPVRFDDTQLNGLDAGAGWLVASEFTPERLADLINQKIAASFTSRRSFLSPVGATVASRGRGWRLFRPRYAGNALEGNTVNGPWHRAGMDLLCLASSLSLAVLETFSDQVIRDEMAASDWFAVQVEFPPTVSGSIVELAVLPRSWPAVSLNWLPELVSGWYERAGTCMLTVPSPVSPLDDLFLVNRRHPRAAALRVTHAAAIDLKAF